MSKHTNTFLVGAILLAQTLGSTAGAQAQTEPTVMLSAPQYSGTGCPTGTLSSALTSDGAAVSLLFDSLIAMSDTSTPVDRKSCNIAIPLQIPQGTKVTLIGVDYRGFNDLPVGAKAEVFAKYVFSGSSVLAFNTTFYGPLLENYFFQNTLNADNPIGSSCGGDNVFHNDNAIVVTTNAAGDQAMSTIDSMDVAVGESNRTSGLTFHFLWQNCTTTTTAPAQTPRPSGAMLLHPSATILSGLAAFLCLLLAS